jgi:hypothetical protein
MDTRPPESPAHHFSGSKKKGYRPLAVILNVDTNTVVGFVQ